MEKKKNANKTIALITGVLTLVLTFVICIPFFIVLNKKGMTLAEIPGDMFATVCITGTVCALLQINTVKKNIAAGKVTPIDISDQAAYGIIPAKLWAFLLAMIVFNFFIWDCGVMGFMHVFFPNATFGVWGYRLFKSFVVGLGAGFENYHANIFYLGLYNKEDCEKELAAKAEKKAAKKAKK